MSEGLSNFQIKYFEEYNIGIPKVIFDIGAFNIVDSLRFAKEFPECEIHAFEPNPYALSEKNKELMKDTTIIYNELALFDKRGVMELAIHKIGNRAMSNASIINLNKADEIVQVNTITMDEYCNTFGIEEIDFMQLDVESAELEVLHGMKNIRPKMIFIEMHWQITPIEKIKNTITWFDTNNYKLVLPEGYKPGTARKGVDFLYVRKDYL